MAPLKLYLTLSFFSLILLIPQPALSQQIDPESSPILESGIISTKNKDYSISNDFDVREFLYGKILRISGTTIDRNFYYVYHKITDDEIISRGKIFLDGNFVPLEFNKVSEQIPKEPSTLSELPEMKILVQQTERVYWTEDFVITVRVFDAKLNTLNDFNQNWGYLEDVDITVEIINPENELLTSFNGRTEKTGNFEASFFVFDKSVKGEHIVKVFAGPEGNQATETLSMFVLGNRPVQD